MATRRERVVLELQDMFTKDMLKAAGATALLNRELNSLSGQSVRSSRATKAVTRDIASVRKSADDSGRSINQLTGRLRLFADVASLLGPGLVPIGAVAIPAVTGLANQLGVAALAGGTAIAAFQGVGDALKAVNEAALEPTQENLAAAGEELAKLSPAAQQLVMRLREIGPALKGLRDAAASGMFPGLIAGLDALEGRLPDVERIIDSVSSTLGDMLAGGGASLASGRWDDFFDFLATDASETLSDLGHIVGDLTHGMAELWMAFSPLNNDFSGWMVDVADSFDRWATGLDQTEGFQEFVDYIRENGPQVADTMGALGDAVLQIVEASAPLGGPVLQALEAIATVVATIADSDLGTPLIAGYAALRLLARGQQAFGAVSATTWAQAARGADGYVGRLSAIRTGLERGGAAAGLFALSMTDMDEKLGVSNIALGTLTGLMLGGPWGAAIGAGVGGFADIRSAGEDASRAVGDTARQIETLRASLAKGTLTSSDLDTIIADAGRAQAAAEKWSVGDVLRGAYESNLAVFSGNLDREFSREKEIDAFRDLRAAAYDAEAAIRAEDFAKDAATTSALLYADGVNASASALRTATMDSREFAEATQDLNGALGLLDAHVAYQASLDAFSAGLKESLSFDADIAEGRTNISNFTRLIGDAITEAEKLKEEGKDLEAQRVLQQAQRDIGKYLPKTKEARDATREVRRELNDLAGTYDAKINVDMAQALAGIGTIASKLDYATRPRSVRITTLLGSIGTGDAVAPRSIPGGPKADGGTIPGQRAPYGDKVLTYLAPGEEVISNRHGQADRNRALLKAINDNRMADGGTVGVQALAGGGTVRDVNRLGLSGLRRELKLSEKAVEREREQRDALREKMTDLSSQVADKFTSGLFGQSGWNAADPTAILRKDIADARASTSAVKQLKAKGVTGDALAAILEQGDLMDVQQMAGMSTRDLRSFQWQFNQRERVNAFAGSQASSAAFGKQYAAQAAQYKRANAHADRVEKQLKAVERATKNVGPGVAKSLNRASASAKRNQSRGRA